MSLHAINWALSVPVPPTQKHVLLVLANFANKNGLAFPSTRLVAHQTGLSERSVIRAKTALLQQKILLAAPDGRRGSVRLACDPTPSPSEEEQSASLPERTQKNSSSEPSHQGSRLPQTWYANSQLIDYAGQYGLDPHRQVEDFRDYWHSATGQNAIKCDWDAAFRLWCRKSADFQKWDKSPHRHSTRTSPHLSRTLSPTEQNRLWVINAAKKAYITKNKGADV
ncbi:hypothetical protein GS501_04720 [Saccharibacter sp. 17.LH.SD]|uniref:helix-turn-helix domain-containing protein n=1 Tax=Saccharibacter sp. 17.LH.SD TaxID=2689393 RepID=UPI001368EE67|nr:helix-turn-helix domain-containing protein [Saccharibacter sp. 17.LH.SD]MXV44349.1 hypothetical protein [Saccharibacter sp. 17.LH.SD]